MAHEADNKNDNNGKDREVIFFPEKAVLKELGAVPERHRDRFLVSLGLVAAGQQPTCQVEQLSAVDSHVYELKINGSPAWRCVYYSGDPGKIVVLHATEKTTNGPDRQIMNVVRQRLKRWKEESRRR